MANTISFRAECLADWQVLQIELDNAGITYQVVSDKENMGEPEVELLLTDHGIDDVYDCMCAIVDGHVMSDTVRPVNLESNSLERRCCDEKPTDWMSGLLEGMGM